VQALARKARRRSRRATPERLKDRTLTVDATLTDGNEQIGSFTLERNQTARLMKCR
jgi:hypothetical protein